MKIIAVGGTGTIGKHVVASLQSRHEILTAGSRSGDYQVDIKVGGSVRRLIEQTGHFDALISTAGKAHFGDFAELTEREVAIGLNDKLMGQLNLVLTGRDYIKENGSFTLTSAPPARAESRQPGW